MGTPGVPWIVEKDTISDALKKTKGRIEPAAKILGVAGFTLRRRLTEYPDLQELVTQLRSSFEQALLDQAEDTIEHAMNQTPTDLNNALKSAFFVLNSKGKERGWTNTHTSSNSFYFNEIDPTKCQADQCTAQVPVQAVPVSSLECSQEGCF